LWKDWKEEMKAFGVRAFKNDDDVFELNWYSDLAAYEEQEVELEAINAEARVGDHSVLADFAPLEAAEDLLRPYQVPAVATLLEALRLHKFTIDASETGLGKTFTAGAASRNMEMNVGVVCPANVVTKWTDTLIDIFGIEPEFVLSYNKLRTGKTDYLSRYDGGDRTHFEWHAVDDVLLIFDEIHECANSTSLNARMLRAAIRNPYVYVLGLSATATQDPRKMDDIGWGLGLHSKNNFWDWCLRYGCKPGFFGGLDFNPKSKRGKQGLANIHATIFPRRAARLRRTDPDVAKDLPDNVVIVEVVDIEKVKVSEEMKDILDAELAKIQASMDSDATKAEEKEMEVSSLVTNTRERQLSELGKVPFMYDRLMELLDQGRHVGIFLQFSGSILAMEKLIAKDKEARWRKYVGGMTRKKRDEVIKEFNENKIPILILQGDAGSASIDLHDTISPGYSAIKLIQALGRMDRNGAKSDILQYIVFSSDPVELRAAKLVQGKLNCISLLNDGDLQGVLHLDV
jgi:hypothetical protein